MNRAFNILLVSTITFFFSGCSGPYPELPTVKSVELEKYVGTWYEIASFPNQFQKGCTCTTATYGKADDFVTVNNRCFRDGEWSDIKGKAFPVEGSNSTKLKVQFFWPFRGDYYIIELDNNYKYVLVGNPSRDYLWILSRTPELDETTIDKLKAKAEELGFDSSKLVRTEQNC